MTYIWKVYLILLVSGHLLKTRKPGVTYEYCDVVVVPFPFVDKSFSKRRPALVISSSWFNSQHEQIVLSMITTARHSKWISDVALIDFELANLVIGSTVRFKLFTLEKSLIIRQIGHLSSVDEASVTSQIENIFQTNSSTL